MSNCSNRQFRDDVKDIVVSIYNKVSKIVPSSTLTSMDQQQFTMMVNNTLPTAVILQLHRIPEVVSVAQGVMDVDVYVKTNTHLAGSGDQPWSVRIVIHSDYLTEEKKEWES